MGNLVSMLVDIYLYMWWCICLCVDMYMCIYMIVSCKFIRAHIAFVCTLWLCTALWGYRQCRTALYKLDLLLLLLLCKSCYLFILLFNYLSTYLPSCSLNDLLTTYVIYLPWNICLHAYLAKDPWLAWIPPVGANENSPVLPKDILLQVWGFLHVHPVLCKHSEAQHR